MCFDLNITVLALKSVKSLEEIFALESSLDLAWTTMIFVKNFKPFFALVSLNSMNSPRLRKNRRFQRFSNFASVEIKGQIFMTPQDFLENIVFNLPKPRIKRQVCSTTYIILKSFLVWNRLRIRKCRKEIKWMIYYHVWVHLLKYSLVRK